MGSKNSRSDFGNVRQLPSKRFQARYVGPDMATHNGPRPFTTRTLARGWLRDEQRLIEREIWTPPAERRAEYLRRVEEAKANTFAAYARRYLRERDLRPKTVAEYERLLRTRLLPVFGNSPITNINLKEIRRWRESQPSDTPAQNAAAYRLLHSILAAAEEEEWIDRAPARIKGAATAKPKHKPVPASFAELDVIYDAMPAPLRMAVVIAAFGALREGEILELRRKDIDLKNGTISVSRAVSKDAVKDPQVETCPNCRRVIGPPKTDAGTRVLHLPGPFHDALRGHVKQFAAPGSEGLLFPGVRKDHMSARYLLKAYKPAAEAAGRSDLTFHDLRHTGMTLAGLTGATSAQLQHRAGHSSQQAMAIYQHADQVLDKQVADAIGQMYLDAHRPPKKKDA